jgi:hypothetical protein
VTTVQNTKGHLSSAILISAIVVSISMMVIGGAFLLAYAKPSDGFVAPGNISFRSSTVLPGQALNLTVTVTYIPSSESWTVPSMSSTPTGLDFAQPAPTSGTSSWQTDYAFFGISFDSVVTINYSIYDYAGKLIYTILGNEYSMPADISVLADRWGSSFLDSRGFSHPTFYSAVQIISEGTYRLQATNIGSDAVNITALVGYDRALWVRPLYYEGIALISIAIIFALGVPLYYLGTSKRRMGLLKKQDQAATFC